MKRKLLLVLLTITAIFCCAFGFSACGSDGKSAYELAVENGYKGTLTEWLESLKGTNGTNGSNGANGTNGTNGNNGSDGKSAYELAVENGYTGTLSEWLESLKGKDGSNGSNGADGVSVVGVAMVDDEIVVYYSDGTSQIVPQLNTVPEVTDITVGDYTAENLTYSSSKYYKLVVPEGETYAVQCSEEGYIYLGQVEYSQITKGNVFIDAEKLGEEWDISALSEGTYYLRVVSTTGSTEVTFKVTVPAEELTVEQLYEAYRSVSHAIFGGTQPAVYGMRKARRAYSAPQHKYDIHALEVFEECMFEPETPFDAADWLAGDDELQIYFRLPEYCLAQEGFELDIWHFSNAPVYGNSMVVKVWCDSDNIYFSYSISFDEFSIFSYSVLDYDFETGDFYCTIFVGATENIYNATLSNIEMHRVYEIAYESGKFSGYFDGTVYDSVSGKLINRNFLVEDFENITEEEQAKLDKFIARENTYLTDMHITEQQFAETISGLNDAVNDEFANNYFIALDCLDQNVDYAGRAAELKSLIEEFPVECAYITIANRYIDDLEYIIEHCSDSDSWVHYNGIALFEAIEEQLREGYLIKVKDVFEGNSDENVKDESIYYIFREYNLETQTFPTFYTDEACTQPFTFEDFSALKLDSTDDTLYRKFDK